MPSLLPSFQPGLPAARVDHALRAALAVLDQAQQSALLWFHEVLTRQLYQELGFASMELYAGQALGFSANRTSQFMKLARDLERLPPLKQAVVEGRLEWTKAQQVARVASPRTAATWVDVARGSSRRDLASKVKAARLALKQRKQGHQGALALEGAAGPALPSPALPSPALPPPRVTVTLSFDSLDAAHLEAMLEAAKKARLVPATATREEAILAAMGALLEGGGGESGSSGDGKGGEGGAGDNDCEGGVLRRRNAATPYKVVLYRCGACQTTEVVTGSGRRRVDPNAAAAALENAEISDQGSRRSRSALAPGLRRKVFMRDGHRCQGSGCRSTRFLEVHHRLPRAHGGSDQPDNLVTLCSRCHRFAHQHRHRHPQAAGATGGERPPGSAE